MRTFFRIATTVCVGLLAALLYFTAETVVEELGWVELVRKFVREGWSAVIASGYSLWIFGALLFVLGAATVLWVDYLVRRKNPLRNTVTKIEHRVKGKHFTNEIVPLDGYSYTECHFTNVKLLYNGGLFEFSRNSIEGMTVASDLPEIEHYVQLIGEFGMLSVGVVTPDGPLSPDGVTFHPGSKPKGVFPFRQSPQNTGPKKQP